MMQINSNFRQIEPSDHLPILQKVGKHIEKFELKEMKFQVHSAFAAWNERHKKLKRKPDTLPAIHHKADLL